MSTTADQPRVTRHPVQQLDFSSDTREILRNATRDIETFGLRDRLIVDIDSHHEEILEWDEVLGNLDDEVLRDYGRGIAESVSGRGRAPSR